MSLYINVSISLKSEIRRGAAVAAPRDHWWFWWTSGPSGSGQGKTWKDSHMERQDKFYLIWLNLTLGDLTVSIILDHFGYDSCNKRLRRTSWLRCLCATAPLDRTKGMAQSLAGDGMPMKMKIITPETSRNLLHIFASITSCWRWVNLFSRLAVAFLCHFCEQLFGSMWYSELRFSKSLRDHNQILPCHSVFLYVPLSACSNTWVFSFFS